MINLHAKPFYLQDDTIAAVENLIDNMREEEKIGQLFVPIAYSSDPFYLKNQMLAYHIGGIMYRPGP